MHRGGHYGTALIAYAPVAFALLAVDYVELAVAGGAVVVGGAMLPDLDQRIPGVKHRGPTHTVWFALAVGAVLGAGGAVFGVSRGVFAAVALGLFGLGIGTLAVAAHLLGDVLTPAGIRPFAPVSSKEYTLDVAKAANPIANYSLLAVGVLVTSVAVVASGVV